MEKQVSERVREQVQWRLELKLSGRRSWRPAEMSWDEFLDLLIETVSDASAIAAEQLHYVLKEEQGEYVTPY